MEQVKKLNKSVVVDVQSGITHLKEGIISLGAMLNKKGCGKLHILLSDKEQKDDMSENVLKLAYESVRSNIFPQVIPQITFCHKQGAENLLSIVVCDKKKPYKAFGSYYIREGKDNRVMTEDEVADFFLEDEYSYRLLERQDSHYPIAEANAGLVRAYAESLAEIDLYCGVYGDIAQLLTKLQFTYGDNLNNAGYYLFGRNNPLSLDMKVPLCSKDGEEIVGIRVRGNLFECIFKAIEYCHDHSTGSIDEDTIAYLLLDAFNSKMVKQAQKIKEKVFRQQHEYDYVYNGYETKNDLSLRIAENAEYIDDHNLSSIIENPISLVADAIAYQGDIELYHKVIEKVMNGQSESNSECNSGSDKIEMKIYEMIRESEAPLDEDFSRALHIDVPKAARAVRNLVLKGLIKRVGTKKSGGWICTDKEEKKDDVIGVFVAEKPLNLQYQESKQENC